ncbi:hypothetical protein [Streptomyces canus]|uniref:hypothetical protein n=1 Tax=Streptomyces canus TaxID=58343 RepID=UPI0030E5745B
MPTAGAATPLLPVCCRFLAESEPLQRITGGDRSILCNGTQGGAGLDRGWVRMAVGLIAAALFGFGSDGAQPRRSGTQLTCPLAVGGAKVALTKRQKLIGFHFVHIELTSQYDHRSEAKY